MRRLLLGLAVVTVALIGAAKADDKKRYLEPAQ